MFTSLSFFELASDLSTRFAGVALENTDSEITNALRRIIDFFAADCCMVFRVLNSEDQTELVHIQDSGRTKSSLSSFDAQELGPLLFHNTRLEKQGVCLHVPQDLTTMPGPDLTFLADLGIASLIVVPVSAGMSHTYLLTLASTRSGHRWSNADVMPFRLLAEMLVGALCRKNLQDALHRATRDLSETQRIFPVGRWEWDVDTGKILQLEMIDRVLGVKPDTQSRFMELVHATDRTHLQRTIDNALSKKAREPLIEYRMYTRRGETRIIRSRFEVSQSESGTRVLGSFHDVTSIRRREQELQLLRAQHWHADRIARTGVLVASLAHELSQPLTAILTNAQAGLHFLSPETFTLQEIQDILNDIVGDSKRAISIIEALRAMMHRRKTTRDKVNVLDVAHEVLELVHGELVAQQVEVELTCDTGCVVLADKTQIEQVLLNLIMNSIESMRDQPANKRRLRIHANRINKDEVQVSARDSGIGIPKDQLNSVFEPFWTTKDHGLGMGLGVCRSIIEEHRGRIWAECNTDQGATFHFRLPLATRQEALGEIPRKQ